MSGWRKRQIAELKALRESPSKGVSDEIRISRLERELEMSVNISMDEFEDLMNEGPAVKVGKYSFGRGTTLRRCDPVAFHIEYCTYCASVEEEMDNE